MGPPPIVKPVGTVKSTLVTVPVVEEVPAPIAVLKSAADNGDIVLSALILGNETVPGLGNVKKFDPTVVPPKEVLPVAGTSPVAPPSQG